MQPCRILIADDELLARQAIKLALPVRGDLHIIAMCSDGDEAAEKIRHHLPDLIFLDIQMPAKTGFEVVRTLPPDYYPYLIIVSAYDNYALEAYENSAADYLLKPFTQERFDKALDKAMRQWELRKVQKEVNASRPFADRMAQLTGPAYRSRISIKEGARITVIPCDEVLYFEASGDYVTVNTTKKKYLHTEPLAALEKLLDPAVFVRTHRSFIVNVRFIKELNSHYNGDYTIVLQQGSSLKLSRNYREQLMQLIR